MGYCGVGFCHLEWQTKIPSSQAFYDNVTCWQILIQETIHHPFFDVFTGTVSNENKIYTT